jgi:hypothetical protein
MQWVSGALFLAIKRPEREADHSHPSSARLRMCGAIPPLSNTCSRRGAQLSTGITLRICLYFVVLIKYSAHKNLRQMQEQESVTRYFSISLQW